MPCPRCRVEPAHDGAFLVIGRLKGELIVKQPPRLMIDVHGVGYEMEAPLSTFFDLPEIGEQVVVFTHFHVREDLQSLFAFASEADRQVFRDLIRVNGVGAKMALAILSGMTASELAHSVHAGDVAALTRLPGIGKKTAERLLIELRDRLDVTCLASADSSAPQPVKKDHHQEATEALIALGYKPQEASRMLATASPDLTTEELIREALKGSLK